MKEIHEYGFDFVLCPVEPLLAMHKAVKTMMEAFLRNPTPASIAKDLTPFAEFNSFIGLDQTLDLLGSI